jgi:hypothetical protein
VVRFYREDDTPQLFTCVRESIPEVSAWLGWCHQNYSIEESRDFVRSKSEKAETDGMYSWYL